MEGRRVSVAEVKLWGTVVGAVSWDPERECAYFQYQSQFAKSGVQVAPLMMPLSQAIYSFPALEKNTFHGLPGMLADSLPDKFGNAVINAWLAQLGRPTNSMNPVERLCYIGSRGMGALEFVPATGPRTKQASALHVEELVALAGEILRKRDRFKVSLQDKHKTAVLGEILKIGTSAGGARPKAIISWNATTNEVRSGQVDAEPGFTHWLLKFDGVSASEDKGFEQPKGYGLIEYVYYKMALNAGIRMSECRILEENGRHHFMAQRFDRTPSGEKLHMQSLGAMAHFDFNRPAGYSYEQAFAVLRSLALPMADIEQLFRRMTFNIIARNQDDHVKNIAFLMDKSGSWCLSPAYDMTYAYDSGNVWMARHQMSLNGKRDNFVLDDFEICARTISLKRGLARTIVRQVQESVLDWRRTARDVGLPEERVAQIARTHRIIDI
ncbi:MAG: type II toxin-antitoxin system HipA family toxin [Cyanobacteria bacterium SZAS TMP-1]|nr:type II toxin-antitoxin system HipA family toxin [Cyanobacteria bacterium SZAS TMP-1]